MRRYIDAYKIEYEDMLRPRGNGNYEECQIAYRDQIDDIPTADVLENEHAYWILDPDGMDWGLPAWKCSRCGVVNNNIGVVEDTGGLEQNPFLWAGSKYCPNCGAQMER